MDPGSGYTELTILKDSACIRGGLGLIIAAFQTSL